MSAEIASSYGKATLRAHRVMANGPTGLARLTITSTEFGDSLTVEVPADALVAAVTSPAPAVSPPVPQASEEVAQPAASSDRAEVCDCGHERGAHFWGTGMCTGRGIGHPGCECEAFTLAATVVPSAPLVDIEAVQVDLVKASNPHLAEAARAVLQGRLLGVIPDLVREIRRLRAEMPTVIAVASRATLDGVADACAESGDHTTAAMLREISANVPGGTVGQPAAPAPRAFTPDRRNADGSTTVHVKRCCNGCGEPVGDVTEAEINCGIAGLPLLDVRSECANCSGGAS